MYGWIVEDQSTKALHNSGNAERLLNAGWSGLNEILAGRLVTLQPRSNPKRLVQPRELGALAAFLCHQDALGITMEDIQLNAAALW